MAMLSACINQLLTLRNNVHLGKIPREDIIFGIDLLCIEGYFYVYLHNYTINVIVQLHVHVQYMYPEYSFKLTTLSCDE